MLLYKTKWNDKSLLIIVNGSQIPATSRRVCSERYEGGGILEHTKGDCIFNLKKVIFMYPNNCYVLSRLLFYNNVYKYENDH